MSTLNDLKNDVLSALSQFSSAHSDLPEISSIDEFELCRKEVQPAPRGTLVTVRYTLLEEGKTVKQLGLSNWEALYVRYKDASGPSISIPNAAFLTRQMYPRGAARGRCHRALNRRRGRGCSRIAIGHEGKRESTIIIEFQAGRASH